MNGFIYEELSPAIVAILTGNGEVIGTGFFVTSEGYMLTCYHVIRPLLMRNNANEISIKTNQNRVLLASFEESKSRVEDDIDFAVLKVQSSGEVPCLRLGKDLRPDEPWCSRGYSFSKRYQDVPNKGTIFSKVNRNKYPGYDIKLTSQTPIRGGASGSPLLNSNSGCVTGVIKSRPTEDGGWEGFAVPMEDIFARWPELEKLNAKSSIILEMKQQEFDQILDADCQSSEAIEWHEKGKAHQTLEQYGEALNAYNRAIKIDPNLFDAFLNKARIFLQIDMPIESIRAADRAIKLNLINSEAWTIKGIALIKLGDFKNAIDALDNAIRIDPENGESLCYKGVALTRLEKYEDALKLFNRALKKDYEIGDELYNKNMAFDFWLHKAIAMSNAEFGYGYHQALEAFEKAIEINPRSAEAQLYKANAVSEHGFWGNAINEYDIALEINPQSTEALIQKGFLYQKLSEYDMAISCYDKAIEIDPSSYIAYFRKGEALDSKDNFEDAANNYNKAIQLSPKLAWAWYRKAGSLKAAKKYDEALSAYTKAIELSPKSSIAWKEMGMVLLIQNRKNEAMQAFNNAIELDAELSLEICRNLRINGHNEDALTILNNFPMNKQICLFREDAYIEKGIVLRKLKRFEDAMKYLQVSNDEKFLCQRGYVLLDLGKYKEALELFRQADDIFGNPRANNGKGLAYLAMGEKELAKNAFKRAEKLGYKEDPNGY